MLPFSICVISPMPLLQDKSNHEVLAARFFGRETNNTKKIAISSRIYPSGTLTFRGMSNSCCTEVGIYRLTTPSLIIYA